MIREPLLDFQKIEDRVEQIANSFKPVSAKSNNSNWTALPFTPLKPMLPDILYKVVSRRPDYWKEANLKVRTDEAFMECMAKFYKTSKIIGKGAFGTMFDSPRPDCIPNIPKDVKHVAVKVEILSDYYDYYQSPAAVASAYTITKKAASLGVAPNIYDCFISVNENGMPVIIKVYELINGTAWANMEWKSEAQKNRAIADLEKKIIKMNKNGIIHHDLHTENVMVSKSNEVFIVDFDRARLVKEEELVEMPAFNERRPWSSSPSHKLLGPDVLEFVYKTLLEEGSVVPSRPVSQTRKNKKEKRT